MSLIESTNLSFFTKLANHNRRLFLPLLGLGIALWVFEVSPVHSQELQLDLPEESGPVGHPIPQVSGEEGPKAIPEKKVSPKADAVQEAPAMGPLEEHVDPLKQRPLQQERVAKVVEPSGPATWAWLPAPVRNRLARAETIPWREAADEVLIPRSQVRWPRYLGSLLKTPAWIDLAGDFRVRYEGKTNPSRKGEFGTADQVAFRTRVRLGLSGQIFRFLVEFQDSRAEFVDPGERFSTGTESTNDILQLFGSATFRNVMGTGFRTDLHIGRLTMDFGRRRLVARNRFRNTTNAFDGAHWHLARGKQWHMRAFLVRPVAIEAKGVNALFGADETLFWGVYYETQQIPWLRTNLYYFGLNDRPSDVTLLRQYSTFGLRFSKRPRREGFDYEGETAWQVGTAGTTGGKKDHFAHMHHVEIGYTFNVRATPRLVIQYDYASGTRSPGGSQHGTFDNLFGGRNWEFMPTGIFGPFFRSNISSPGARIFARPVTRVPMTLMLKYRAWWLAQSRDTWVGSGLQDATGGSGNFLGQDIELKARWTVSPNFKFTAGYDHFFKGSYIESLAKVPGNPSAADTDYFFIQTEIKF